MRIYALYVINGVNSFEVNVEAETCEPTKEGFFLFYNHVGTKKNTVATYPIGCTVIQKITTKGTESTTAVNGKINHNETTL
jgi:hypothetical protein